ncbi:hypothetical protein D3C73_1428300 [compost metagenome]
MQAEWRKSWVIRGSIDPLSSRPSNGDGFNKLVIKRKYQFFISSHLAEEDERDYFQTIKRANCCSRFRAVEQSF